MPQHLHFLQAANKDGDAPIPTGNRLANFNNGYGGATNLTPLRAGPVSNIGGSQAHNNMCPYLVINFCIALQGIFPSQT
jgi:microcystin-dependent protein